MSAVPVHIAHRAVRWWVALYTWGLPLELRASRRAEIESDLWEQEHDARFTECDPDRHTWQVLGRWLFGICTDLSWRWETGMARTNDVHMPDIEKRLLAAAVLWIAIGMVGGMAEAFFAVSPEGATTIRLFGRLGAAAITGFAPAILVTGGLLVQRRRPIVGTLLLLAGVVPMGIWTYWTIIGPALAMLIAVLAVRRASDLSALRPASR